MDKVRKPNISIILYTVLLFVIKSVFINETKQFPLAEQDIYMYV
jgi:hypothetical protein